METLEESLIPSYVWKFVKQTIKSPIAQGILALIIWHYLRKRSDKKKEQIKLMNSNSFSEKLNKMLGDNNA